MLNFPPPTHRLQHPSESWDPSSPLAQAGWMGLKLSLEDTEGEALPCATHNVMRAKAATSVDNVDGQPDRQSVSSPVRSTGEGDRQSRWRGRDWTRCSWPPPSVAEPALGRYASRGRHLSPLRRGRNRPHPQHLQPSPPHPPRSIHAPSRARILPHPVPARNGPGMTITARDGQVGAGAVPHEVRA